MTDIRLDTSMQENFESELSEGEDSDFFRRIRTRPEARAGAGAMQVEDETGLDEGLDKGLVEGVGDIKIQPLPISRDVSMERKYRGEFKLMQIVDFTDILKLPDNYIVFNPCITFYKDDLYLLSVRIITRALHHSDYNELFELQENPYSNLNHPWRNMWGFNLKDRGGLGLNGRGVDYTRMYMIKIINTRVNNFDIKIVKNYYPLYNDILNRDFNNPLAPKLAFTKQNAEDYVYSLESTNRVIPPKNEIDANYDIYRNSDDYKYNPQLRKQVETKYDDFYNALHTQRLFNGQNFDDFQKLQRVSIEPFFLVFEDIRIHRTRLSDSDGIFFLTGNKRTNSRDYIYRKNQHEVFSNTEQIKTCADFKDAGGCDRIHIIAIKINPLTIKIEFITPSQSLCKEFAAKRDKNWTIYYGEENDTFETYHISYQIVDTDIGHEKITFSFRYDEQKNIGEFSNCDDNKYNFIANPEDPEDSSLARLSIKPGIVSRSSQNIYPSFFKTIEEAFSIPTVDEKGVIKRENLVTISTTTTTSRYSDDEFLSVGHVKYKYNYFDPSAPINQLTKDHIRDNLFNAPIGKFTQFCANELFNFHYEYIYLFFFYTFDNNGLLRRTSKFFLPLPINTSLVFPVGLFECDGYFGLSFGEYDTRCSAMFFSEQSLENSLYEINNINFPFNQYLDSQKTPQISEKIAKEIINFDFFKFTSWENNKINKIIL
jgi:hypothetical protein